MLPQKWQAGASLCTLKADPSGIVWLTAPALATVASTVWLNDPALDWTPIACWCSWLKNFEASQRKM